MNTAPLFSDLHLDDRILQTLSELGYESPSPVQAAAIPPLLEGRHVVGLAQTGTGKTAAFALPILSRLDASARKPQALILAPTRELALQVAEAFGRYARHLPEISVVPVYGGQAFGPQLGALRRGAQIVVGTPGRVIDHLNRGTLDLSDLHFLVLDEADEMLQMGFQEDVETILEKTPDSKQVALFSATMPPQIRRISQKYLTDAVSITVESQTRTAENIRQRYIRVPHHEKVDALTRILEVESYDAVIVFVRTKSATEEVAERLRGRGFSAAAINGDLAQNQRERTINQLKNGQLDVLVATDVAARGLDVERITHVVNYDIPHDSEAYVHRIGRTGRAGRSGEALLFVTPRERHLLSSIERATRQPIEEIPLPSVDDVNETRVTRFTEQITKHLGASESPVFRDLIAKYAQENDVELLDVAAAVAVMGQDGTAFLLPPDPPPAPRRPRELRDAGTARGETRGGAPRVAGAKRRRAGGPMATYRIDVGRRHRVQPGAIVGALANEGGLGREDFGHIDIRADHSLVELPADLPEGTAKALEGTRISGKLIRLTPAENTGFAPRTGPRKPRY